MKSKGMLLALALLLATPAMAQISGQYIEARTADVYTGPCFANSEVNLTGHEAVLAWHIEKGVWQKTPLEGLNVVAVVRASATLGDPYANPLPAKAVLIVDARANEAQRKALVNFARAQAGALLANVVAVETSPIRFAVDAHRHGFATLEAANLARISTRALTDADEVCHNEETFYPPLTSHLTHAMPAVTVRGAYHGNHLGVNWDESGRRGSFVASFSL
jgi:hypothetical protein